MRRTVLVLAALLCCAAARGDKVACESFDGNYRECRVGGSGRVLLVQELSDMLCIEGVTWGTRMDGVVWVTRGCRAIFETGTTSKSIAKVNDRVVCESQFGGRSVCPVPRGMPVTLLRQLSSSPCLEGGTWGHDPEAGQIWVIDGCRGEFLLGPNAEPERPLERLDGVVVCESKNGERQTCAADTRGGVRIIRPFNDATCRFGQEWGYDRSGIWVTAGCRAEFAVRGKSKPVARAINCESHGDARVDCPGDTGLGVAIVRQTGEKACVLGETWGFGDGGVWVTKGCSAQFVLGGYRLPPEAVPSSASRVVCESNDGKRVQCPADTTRGIGLVRQTSQATCILNRTWGYERDTIWVTDGCQAEFAVGR